LKDKYNENCNGGIILNQFKARITMYMYSATTQIGDNDISICT